MPPKRQNVDNNKRNDQSKEGLHGVFYYKDPEEMRKLVGQGKFVVTPVFANTKVYCGHCKKKDAVSNGRKTSYYTYGSLFHHTRECQGWRDQMHRYKRAQNLRANLLKPLPDAKEQPEGEGVCFYQSPETMLDLLGQGKHVVTPMFVNTKVYCGHCGDKNKESTPTFYTYTSLFHHYQKCPHWKEDMQRYREAQEKLTGKPAAGGPAAKKAKTAAATKDDGHETETDEEEGGDEVDIEETEDESDDDSGQETDDSEDEHSAKDDDRSPSAAAAKKESPQELLTAAQAEKSKAEAAQIMIKVRKERMEAAFSLLKKRHELKEMGVDQADIDQMLPLEENVQDLSD